MTHTTNYNLNKFESSDAVESAVSAFNDNMDIIDSALGGYGLNKLESSDTVENAVSVFNANMDTIDSAMGSGGTILPKTITANGTYNASADSADGYSPVTVNVPQPVITTNVAAADLAHYTSGQTDLGGGCTITNSSGITGVSTKTVDGVEYTGLDMSGSATFQTKPSLPDRYMTVEFNVIITGTTSGDMRIVSTGGMYFEFTVYARQSNTNLMFCTNQGTIIDHEHLNALDPYNYEDTSLPLANLIDTVLKIKYTYSPSDDRVILYVNNVAKVSWSVTRFNNIVNSYGLNVGANGAAMPAMLVVKAECSGEALSWNGHTYVRSD